MSREIHPGSTSWINERNELIFGTPQWLIDEFNEAKKACGRHYSLSDEFRKIYGTKAHGELPVTTVYAAPDQEAATCTVVKDAGPVKISPVDDPSRQRPRPRHAQESIPEDEDRNRRRELKSAERRVPTPRIGTSSKSPQTTGTPPAANTIVNIQYRPKPTPDWLTAMSVHAMNQALKNPGSERVQAWRSLTAFKGCIERCEKAAAQNKSEEELGQLFEELRDHLHKAEIRLKGVDKYVIRKTNMLTTTLPSIFTTEKVDYPWDLRADAWQLYLRWYDQDFTPDLLRGIITRKKKDRASDSIDPEWRKNQSLGTSANFHGQGNLVLGQWWPTQLCAVRDRAHGSPQGGISGAKGQGAFSIVLSTGGYQDRDEGDEIWYSGTEAKTNEPTENTQRLIETCEQFPHRPVRVLRSAQLPLKNPYRPTVGLRYDGLYKIVGMEQIAEGKEDYLFHLVRCENQFPIRCEANAARRPTKYEEEEFRRLKENGR